MAQFALLMIVTIFPMQMLSDGMPPDECQPDFIQSFSWLLPSHRSIEFAQPIAFLGAGLNVMWPDFLTVTGLGAVSFVASLLQFRRSLSAGGWVTAVLLARPAAGRPRRCPVFAEIHRPDQAKALVI